MTTNEQTTTLQDIIGFETVPDISMNKLRKFAARFPDEIRVNESDRTLIFNTKRFQFVVQASSHTNRVTGYVVVIETGRGLLDIGMFNEVEDVVRELGKAAKQYTGVT